jgi:hypothetical protein
MISSLGSPRSVSECIGVRSSFDSLQNDYVEDVDEELVNPTDKRIFAISTAFHRGYSVDKIWQMTNIDKWFLNKLRHIYLMEKRLSYVNYLSFCNFYFTDDGVLVAKVMFQP